MKRAIFLALAIVALCAAVLIPFLIWGEAIEQWVTLQLAQPYGPFALAGLVVALLSADIVLPLPSSLVAVGAGTQLGFVLAVAAIFVGLMIGNLIGYALGRRFGVGFAERMMGGKAQLPHHIGTAMLCLTRPVPVLSEAATVIAGAGAMPLPIFVISTGLSNMGIAVVYASLGALASDLDSFLLVFAAAVFVPAAGYAIYWLALRRRVA